MSRTSPLSAIKTAWLRMHPFRLSTSLEEQEAGTRPEPRQHDSAAIERGAKVLLDADMPVGGYKVSEYAGGGWANRVVETILAAANETTP